MTEAVRGIKQAIVAQAMQKHKMTSLTRPVKKETKEEIIAEAQEVLDKKKLGGDARQIYNWLTNPANAEGRSIKEMAERLTTKAAKPAKKTAKARKPHAKQETAESQAAA